MPAPIDPYDFQNLVTIIDANLVNARFRRLFDALDKTRIGLDANSFKDGAFTAVKFSQQAWQTVALGSVLAPNNLAFYKDAIGLVRFRQEGFTTVANTPVETVLATLPAGYRPGFQTYFNLWQYGQTPTFGKIETDGTIRLAGSGPGAGGALTAGTIIFHGTFRAEN